MITFTVKDLIKQLKNFDSNMPILFLDDHGYFNFVKAIYDSSGSVVLSYSETDIKQLTEPSKQLSFSAIIDSLEALK